MSRNTSLIPHLVGYGYDPALGPFALVSHDTHGLGGAKGAKVRDGQPGPQVEVVTTYYKVLYLAYSPGFVGDFSQGELLYAPDIDG